MNNKRRFAVCIVALTTLSASSASWALFTSKLGKTGTKGTHSGNLQVSGRNFVHPQTGLKLDGPSYEQLEFFGHSSLRLGTVAKDQVINGTLVQAGQYIIDANTGNQLAGPFEPGTIR